MSKLRWNYHFFVIFGSTIFIIFVISFLRGFDHSSSRKDLKISGKHEKIEKTVGYDQKVQEMLTWRYKNEFCDHDENCSLLKPFVDYVSLQMLAPRFGISACVIYKNFSTVFTSILCFLFDMIDYRRSVKHMMEDYYEIRHCQRSNEYRRYAIHAKISPRMRRKWTHYMLVREPMERFVSGFINKCINEKTNRKRACYGCDEDMICLMERVYAQLELVANGTKEPARNVEESHFMPQSWSCELGDHFNEYRIFKFSPTKTEEMLNEILDEFIQLGVPANETDWIKDQILSGKKTFHATFEDPKRGELIEEIEKSKELKEWLIRLYYYDYVLFGYPLPRI